MNDFELQNSNIQQCPGEPRASRGFSAAERDQAVI